MRCVKLTVLFLATATTSMIQHAAQGGSPAAGPAPTPTTCYRLVPVKLDGFDHQWARLLTGDKWISGCIGPEGQCYTAIWVPC